MKIYFIKYIFFWHFISFRIYFYVSCKQNLIFPPNEQPLVITPLTEWPVLSYWLECHFIIQICVFLYPPLCSIFLLLYQYRIIQMQLSFFKCLFIYLREEREGREKERVPSRLCAISSDPGSCPEPKPRVRCSTD